MIWSLFFISIFRCCYPSGSWHRSFLETADVNEGSVRLSYFSEDGISLEIRCTYFGEQEKIKTYLNARKIVSYKGCEKRGLIVMTVDKENFQTVAYRHEGGQRLSLSLEFQKILIDALKKKKQVTLSIEGGSITLEPKYFSENFSKLRPSFFTKLFQTVNLWRINSSN